MEAPPGFEPGVEVLQTSALPLGDGAPKNATRPARGRAQTGVRPRSTMERETGFEPATSTLARSHSTTELFPPETETHTVPHGWVGFKRRHRTDRSTCAASSGGVGLM